VSASKVRAAAAAEDQDAYFDEDDQEVEGSAYNQDDDQYSSVSHPELPLSYGERLVLDTYLRGRSRPYDRSRQEELAKPRRRGGDATCWVSRDELQQTAASSSTADWHGYSLGDKEISGTEGAAASTFEGGYSTTSGVFSSMDYLSGSKTEAKTGYSRSTVESCVARLSKPRRPNPSVPRNEGEVMIFKSIQKARETQKTAGEVNATFSRLAAPKMGRPLSPTPGERIILLCNARVTGRRVDTARLSEMAKASRRGGSCSAWGVTPRSGLQSFGMPPIPIPTRAERTPSPPGQRDESILRDEGGEAFSGGEAFPAISSIRGEEAGQLGGAGSKPNTAGYKPGSASSGVETTDGGLSLPSSAGVSRHSTPAWLGRGLSGTGGLGGTGQSLGDASLPPGTPNTPKDSKRPQRQSPHLVSGGAMSLRQGASSAATATPRRGEGGGGGQTTSRSGADGRAQS